MPTSSKIDFILLAAKSLHESGLPTHRVEDFIQKFCISVEVEAELFTTPGSIFASILQDGVRQPHMVKVSQEGDLHLEKIDAIQEVCTKVSDSTLDFPDGIKALDVINQAKSRYPNWLMTLFFGLSTGSAACVFGGNLPEIICSSIIGLVIGIFQGVLVYIPRFGKLFVLLSAVWACCIAALFQSYYANFQRDIATVCGLIILIPGFSFTVSITEMVNNHLIAGLTRFTNAFITFAMIAIGIAFGMKCMGQFTLPDPEMAVSLIPSWSKWIALFFVPVGFMILFKAKQTDFGWILVACWCSYFSYVFGNEFFSESVAVFLASLLLGVVSNLFSRIKKRNSSLMLVPGMILLVPGSLGFFSISHMVQSDVVAGIQTALTMLITSLALVFGVLFSNILVRAER
jgi:uncharacterized membrane protein YjjP (DUF1212 family)